MKIIIFIVALLAGYFFSNPDVFKKLIDFSSAPSMKNEYESRLKKEAQEQKNFDDWQKVTENAKQTGTYIDCGMGNYFVFKKPHVWRYKPEDGRLLFGAEYQKTGERINWTQWPGIQYELHLDSQELYSVGPPAKCTQMNK